MKSTPAKFTVAQLAKTLGKPAKEVLFLLQGIGVDVKGVDSTLDPSTAQAILTGKTQAPKSLIVRQVGTAPVKEAAVPAVKPKPERAALKRIKLVEKAPESTETAEGGAVAAVAASSSAPAAEAAEAAGTSDTPAIPLVVPPSPPEAVEAAPEKGEKTEEAEEAREAEARQKTRKAAAEEKPALEPTAHVAVPITPIAPAPPLRVSPEAVAASVPPPAAAPAPVVATATHAAAHPQAAAATHVAPGHTAPPHRPLAKRVGAASAASASPQTAGVTRQTVPHRPASSVGRKPESGHPAAGPARPPVPSGALGRLLLRRTIEPPTTPPHRLGSPPPMNPPTAPPVEMSTGASAGPYSPGVTTMRTPSSQPPSSAPPAPIRGAGGLGRAVIAAPTAATTRSIRPPSPPAPPARPGALRPGIPVPGRPGIFRPAGPGGRDMGPRPGFSRGPAGPTIPPGPPLPTEKRRKDAAKPTTASKKEDAKKAAAKKPRTKEVSALEENVRDYLGNFQPDTYEDVTTAPVELDEDGNPIVKPLSKSAQRRAGKKTIETDTGNVVEVKKNAPSGPVFLSEGVTVKELSEKIGILAKDLMKAFLARGIFATINQPLDPNVAVEVSREFGVEAAVVSFEEEVELSRQQAAADNSALSAGAAEGKRVPRAPVVTVMGHVDHGKTSLLDAIRKAKVAEGEAGGITQHIGAYRVEVNGREIVFLDTPGHEAFTMMRARGARATDIVVLVVAADDGVMPQTMEAIDHARAAKVPIVVAINKIDKPEANTTRVKQELAEKGVIVEAFGGEVVACEISAKKNVGIAQLLEMILLQADLLELKAVADIPARGVILEARREPGKGTLATVLVQQGTLRVGEVFFAGAAVGRVRAMLDDRGNRILEAGPATPVEVMGFDELPSPGDTLQVVDDEQKARQVASFRVQKERDEALAKSSRTDLASLFSRMEKGEAKDLALIVKADVNGSEEVLVQTLGKLSNEKVKVSVLHSGVGAISVNDVLLASASEAIIIGF
ncbi:MAG TPA: translation initiation factor IF-2, partial [Thermoanaerobaculia bacterium]